MRLFALWLFDSCLILPLFQVGRFAGCLWGALRFGFMVGVARIDGAVEVPDDYPEEFEEEEDSEACAATGSAVV